ncbi:MAG: MATE family efflux transporter, partial [Bacteroidales bacterium]|nr:MATE family efflux transporter [Bacteroidales bacterium]
FGMIVLGITQGMQPILGYNYGARKYDRLRSVLRLGIIISSAVMTVGFAVCVGMPRTMAMLFTSDEVLLNVAAEGLRLSSLAFPLIGVGMVASTFFQSIGKPVQAIITSLSRQLLILIPLLIILPPILGTKGVWLAMPISDTIAFVIAIILMGRQLKILEKQVI